MTTCGICGSVLSAVTFTCVRGQFCKPQLTQGEQVDLAKARKILLMADWEVKPEVKQLARKTVDRLTNRAAWCGFKGQ